jgi:hypothetical protein
MQQTQGIVVLFAPFSLNNRTEKELSLFGDGGYELAIDAMFQDMCEKVEQRSASRDLQKPLFMKRLVNFWASHPQYDASNTLLIENDVEKVDLNPLENVVCPVEWRSTGKGRDDRFLHPKGDFCAMLRELAKRTWDIPSFAQSATLPAVVKSAVDRLFLCHRPRSLPRTVRVFSNQSEDILGNKELGLQSMDRISRSRGDWIEKTGTHAPIISFLFFSFGFFSFLFFSFLFFSFLFFSFLFFSYYFLFISFLFFSFLFFSFLFFSFLFFSFQCRAFVCVGRGGGETLNWLASG